jgi:hypothetical protein
MLSALCSFEVGVFSNKANQAGGGDLKRIQRV